MRTSAQFIRAILVCLILASMTGNALAGHDSGGGGPTDLVGLEIMITNLAPENAQDSRFLQVGIQLKLTDPKEGETVKAYMPKIRHEFLLVMCSHTASSLAEAGARDALVEELKDAANSILGKPGGVDKKGNKTAAKGPVADVLFSSFLVQ